MKYLTWFYNQTRLTRVGIYYLITALAYFISRGVSIVLGYNTRWI